MARTYVTGDTSIQSLGMARPMLVLAFSDWCPYSLRMKRVFDKAREVIGSLDFAWLDVDEQPQLSHQLAIASVPLVLLIRGGAPIASLAGYTTTDRLSQELQSFEGVLADRQNALNCSIVRFPHEL